MGNLKTRKSLQSNFVFILFTIIPLVLYVWFFIYPVFCGFFYSVTNYNGLSNNYSIVGMKNFIKVLQDKDVGNSAVFTLVYTVLVTVIKLALALILAIILYGKIKFRGFFRGLYFFPAVLGMVTIGLIFNQIFIYVVPKIGQSLGIAWLSNNLLASPNTAMIGVLITSVWQGIAIPMVIFMAGLSNVPRDLEEAATLDGANAFQQFMAISLPYLIPMLNVNLVMSIKGGITVFDYIVALTSGGPGGATESIGYLIYNEGFNNFKFGYASAISIYAFLVMAIISFIQIKLLNKKEVGQQ